MSITLSVLLSVGICIISAIAEGLCAGKNVKPFLAKLRSPSYAPPLWIWVIIGIFYYVICFFIIYRIFRHEGDNALKTISLMLVLVLMSINAFFNYIFFRAQNLFYSFLTFIPYIPIAIALFICLLQFEEVAAWAFLPYLLYLTCVTFLCYKFWKLNENI
jgi:tryptophan-rich sensory protein